jgi:hypothetical protein
LFYIQIKGNQIIKKNKTNVSIYFQVSDINTSYRTRGNVPRTHRNPYLIARNFKILVIPRFSIAPAKNNVLVSSLINKILPYSAMNRKANSPLPYSMLNPDTSSDSPSARSNGARLVSANLVRNHMKKMKENISAYQINCWCFLSSNKLNVMDVSKIMISTRAILTS